MLSPANAEEVEKILPKRLDDVAEAADELLAAFRIPIKDVGALIATDDYIAAWQT